MSGQKELVFEGRDFQPRKEMIAWQLEGLVEWIVLLHLQLLQDA